MDDLIRQSTIEGGQEFGKQLGLRSAFSGQGGGGLVKEYTRENTREYSKQLTRTVPISIEGGVEEKRLSPDQKVHENLKAPDTYGSLLSAELEIQRLRSTLLQELKATKQVLLSSLRSLDTIGEEAREEGRRQSVHAERLEHLLLSPGVGEEEHLRGPTSPLSVAASSGHFSATPSPGSELLARLRGEVDQLREERQRAAAQWAGERQVLERQLEEARREAGEVERLRSVEDRLRDILAVIRSLNTMVGFI